LDAELSIVRAEEKRLKEAPSNALVIPPVDDIKALAREAVPNVSQNSPEFGKLMKRIVPKIVVFPYQLCDGGKIVLRAKLRLWVSHLLPDKRVQEVLQQPFERILTVNLYDPPQREACRRRILEMRAGGATEKDAAAAARITITAAQRAAGLQRRMEALCVTDPYVPVTQPPEDGRRNGRHKHRRYRFEPLAGAGEV
jgi:hypothetical protein